MVFPTILGSGRMGLRISDRKSSRREAGYTTDTFAGQDTRTHTLATACAQRLFLHLVTCSKRSLVRFKCLHPLSVYHVIGDRGMFVVIHLPYRKTRLKKTSASQLFGVLSFADLVLLRSTINVLEIEAPPWSTRENRQCSCCSPSSSPGPLRKKVSLLWRYAGLRKTMPDFEHLHEMKTLTIQGAS